MFLNLLIINLFNFFLRNTYIKKLVTIKGSICIPISTMVVLSGSHPWLT